MKTVVIVDKNHNVETIHLSEFREGVDPVNDLTNTLDAKAWAEAFLRVVHHSPSSAFDEEFIITWFANAITKGYDTALPLELEQYHRDAMRTAAGPEVFHLADSVERFRDVGDSAFADPDNPNHREEAIGLIDNDFITDAVDYLTAAAKLDRWKSRFFYNKDKELPDFADYMEGEMSLDNIANPQMIHAILGIATEGAELVEDLLKIMRAPTAEEDGEAVLHNIVRETGDVDWYQELLAEAIKVPVSQSRLENIDRLRKRFPDKFTETDAVERKDEIPESPIVILKEGDLSDEDVKFIRLCEDNAGECKRAGESLKDYVQRLRSDYDS